MRNEVIAFFKKHQGQAFRSKDVAKHLNIEEEQRYAGLKQLLFKLSEEDILEKSGKRYSYNNGISGKITGTLEVNEKGFGFVIVRSGNIQDIFIAEKNMNTAFSGDTVEVALFAKQKGKNLEGEITKVIKRKRTEYVGVMHKAKYFYYVVPDDKEITKDIYVDITSIKKAKEGDKVIVGNLDWADPKQNPVGEIIEVLGKAGSLNADIISIAKDFELPYKFPVKVLEDAEQVPLVSTLQEIENRIDYREKDVFTIDPFDAKDFDDALSIETLENGNYSIGIHIADVGHYVRQNSNIDKEASLRGNSVYLVGKVIPMLPEKLSNTICSLVPGEDRLTYSVIVEMTKRGRVVDYDIKKTIINSKRRFTYEEVQEIIENEKGDYLEQILILNGLAQTLRKKRMKEGSIDFSTAEIKFILDEEGKPLDAYVKVSKEANMLIEEFMLLANKLVATHIAKPSKGKVRPFIYRIHDKPDQEKVNDLATFVRTLGYTFNSKTKSKQNEFQNLMQQVKGKEEENVISELAIRSMAKAIYSINNIGHYGLGFPYYSHFTSPIRRYSDLLVHRLLHSYLDTNEKVFNNPEHLEEICDHISQTERVAIDAERYSTKLKQVEYLKEKVGEEFHAIISGIMAFGMFVKITSILAEGLIRLRDLEDDYYSYNEKKFALVGRHTKKQYRLGDKVQVKLIRVDQEKNELDFIVVNSI